MPATELDLVKTLAAFQAGVTFQFEQQTMLAVIQCALEDNDSIRNKEIREIIDTRLVSLLKILHNLAKAQDVFNIIDFASYQDTILIDNRIAFLVQCALSCLRDLPEALKIEALAALEDKETGPEKERYTLALTNYKNFIKEFNHYNDIECYIIACNTYLKASAKKN